MSEVSPDSKTAVFRVGFKNVLGAGWTRRGPRDLRWSRRSPRLRREMLDEGGMRASAYFFCEVNGVQERWSLSRILRGWDAVRTRGHNDAHSDPRVHRLISRHELPLGTTTGQQRYVTIVAYEHRATGIRWAAATTHLSSSVNTTTQQAEASRALQARTLVRLCEEHRVDVIAADINNISVRPDTPRGILESAGWTDWRVAVEVENADHDTHRAVGEPVLRRGRHLDAIYVGPRVTVLDGRVQVTEPDSSDHFGLVCTLAVRR